MAAFLVGGLVSLEEFCESEDLSLFGEEGGGELGDYLLLFLDPGEFEVVLLDLFEDLLLADPVFDLPSLAHGDSC